MKLLYTDPTKRKLQKIEIAVLIFILPIGIFFGTRTFLEWRQFRKAEILYDEASRLTHMGRYDEGIPMLEASLQFYPAYYGVWEELGVCYHLRGMHEKEVETYYKATRVLPNNGNLYRELATAYHEVGMHGKELESATLAVSLPNTDELFTQRILERAQKEAAGEIVTGEVPARIHQHGPAGHRDGASEQES